MKKQFIILLILIFSLGLFIVVYAAVGVTEISEIPTITSVSPTTVRIGETFEVFGKNFLNLGMMIAPGGDGSPVGKNLQIALTPVPNYATNCGSTDKTAEIISYSDSKLVLKLGCMAPGEGAVCMSYGAAIEGHPELSGSISDCYGPKFTILKACDWECTDWGLCFVGGNQTRTCVKPTGCESLSTPMPQTTQSCTYYPTCTNSDWSCTSWGTCQYKLTSNGFETIQTRNCTKLSNCEGGVSAPASQQSCTWVPECTSSYWSCSSWSACSSSGSQTRNCNKTSSCEGGTLSPATTQSCTYTPPAPTCSVDTWECGSWGICSPQGIKTRSCSRTFDCPSAATASPATSEYCQPPKSTYQVPSDNTGIVNQSSIVKATVKLVCPISSTRASQGTGTIIDSSGTILTNKHVVDGTLGCLVGFIDSYSDEPYFGNRHIADIYRVSSNIDAAILKLRNPSSANLTSINVSSSNSDNVGLGDILTTYGYPAIFGTKITFTSGDFSGVDGEYLKTTAVIEHGNSGGGAYLKSGAFIGIPTAVIKGDLNSLGYILSINRINNWMNGSTYAYDSGSSNNYSRVSSVLDDIDLNSLDSLGLYISDLEPEVYTLDSRAYTGGSSNRLNFRVNWLVKNKKFAEVFWADSDMCLHWIINEEIAERNFGITWNYEGNIHEFDTISEYGYQFCEKLE